MKVAQFIDTADIGGAETVMLELSRELRNLDVEVIIVHLNNGKLVELAKKHQLNTVSLPFSRYYRSIFTLPIFIIKFSIWLKKNKIDVLHSHLYGPISGSFFAACLSNVVHIGTLHDTYLVQERFGRGFILFLTQLFRSKLVTVSKDMLGFYQRYIPGNRKIYKITNGVQIDNYPNTEQEQEIKSTIELITVARLVKLKRHEKLLYMIKDLLNKNPLLRWNIVGDGPEYNSLLNKIKELGLEGQIILHGFTNNVKGLLRKADIFIMFSETEGLSCSVLEALASGVPCVVNDVGGNNELVISGVNGFLINDNEESEFAKKLECLISDQNLRKQFSDNAKEFVEKEYSLTKMAIRYLKLYED
jgi:glycosyltransferase involved in cell wall biosynthesis